MLIIHSSTSSAFLSFHPPPRQLIHQSPSYHLCFDQEQTTSGCDVLRYEWEFYIITLPPEVQRIPWKRRWWDCKSQRSGKPGERQCHLNSAGLLHSKQLWEPERYLQKIKPVSTAAWSGRGAEEELLNAMGAINGCWGGRDSFFSGVGVFSGR